MSFQWIFSIIVGISVLFLAIYAASMFFDLGIFQHSTESAARISVLLDPLETSYDYSDNKLSFATEARLYNSCSNDGYFGTQDFQVQEKTFGSKWGKMSDKVSVRNKYVFSNSLEQGKIFYVSGISFSYPFKVTDLIILHTRPYCFEGTDDDIRNSLALLDESKFNVRFENCSNDKNYVQVCSGSSGCDVNIVGDETGGYVEKDNKRLYYANRLIYAAIFSDSDVYECQIARIAKKIANLCKVYEQKTEFTSLRVSECSTDINIKLAALRTTALAVSQSSDVSNDFITELSEPVSEVFQMNDEMSMCKVWEESGYV